MKNKKISKLVAGTLTATVALNFCSGDIKNISAYAGRNSSSLEESNASSNLDNLSNQTNDLSKSSGVSIDQMQKDFESIADSSNSEKSDEEIVPDGTVVDDFDLSNSLDKLISTLSGDESSSVNPKANSFATFSFDGENAGKIIITDTTISSTAEIRYSLDGGQTWTKTTNHEIQLSEKEINSITADKDIIVGLAAVESYKQTIDIKVGPAPTTSDLYKNDVENKFFGRLNGLQVSTDNGTTWKDYDDSMKFDGRVVTKVRYKPTGIYLTSAVSQFTFTEDTVSKTRTYIPITSITSYDACSEQNDSTYSSNHLVDGNGNTTWTSLAKGNGELYYSVGFNEFKFITEIEYMPSDLQKGRLKSGQIYRSFNGTDWKLVGEFSNIANDKNLKSIKLDTPVSAKYIKIVATETYQDGSASDTVNTYFSGKLLNFYEDSTLEYSDKPVIKYSTEDKTNNYVKATLYLPAGYDADITTYKFLNNGTYNFEYTDDKGQKHTITATVNNITKLSGEKGIYLSDLNNESLLYNAWNGIKKDKNPASGNISLLVNGEKYTFSKGLGIHAPSTVVYDIEAYASEYSRFSAYLGVDSSRNTNGSVKFTISASKDGKNWVDLKKTDVLRGNTNCEYVDLDVSGYTYLKLYADSTSDGTGNDHSVYADARLVKSDYNINSEYYTGFKTLAEYDASISSRSVEENYKNHKKEILEREFVNRIGYTNILTASRDVKGVYEALAWLQRDQEALQLFIEAGGYYSGTGYNAIVALGKLYNEYKDDMTNITYKKMLLGTAAAYSKNLKTFLVNYGGNCREANPVESYKNFKTLYNNSQFVRKSEFESYSMELVRAVMDARINYDEMFWLRDYIEKKYPSSTHINNWVRYNGYGYMGYVNTGYGISSKPRFYDEAYKEEWDKKYNFLKYGISYGETNLYRIWMFMEAGSICWGLSGLGMVVNEVQGIPAIGTFQPGHEAYLLYSQNAEGKGIWSISDDISGWQSSYTRWGSATQTEHRLMLGWGQMDYNKVDGGNNTSYTLLAQDALNDYNNYLNSMFYNLIANSYKKGSEQHEAALNDSLGCYSKNLDAMYGIYKSYLADESTTDQEWIELARKVATEYRYFPAPMVDLLKLIKPQIEDTILQIEVDMLQTESLKKASVATSKESLQDTACRKIANSLLGNNAKDLASFSFDGENANTILINDSYADSTIQVRVSLDGGDTWEKFENDQTFTTSHSIKLTDEQVSRINATDDILVGLMGVTENFTIDIKEGTTITNSILFKNDLENRLIGDTNRLEYSEDDGQTWNDYTSETRFPSDADRVIKVRYKAKGVYLASAVATYTFAADTDTDTRKYITIDHLSIHSFSSQLNSDKASNIIDGNDNTGWHNDSSKEPNASEPRSVVIKLDEVKYVSALEYYSAYNNGKIKSAIIYTSLDGKNWTEVGSCSGWSNNTTVKKLDLEQSSPARYVKIVATETHGYPANTFLTCRTLNLFEDTTKTYVADVSIDYSTTSPTSDNVTATLVLPEGCEVIGDSEHVFEDNGTFEFKYIDANGAEHSIEAKVTWIDKEGPDVTIEYSTTELTNQDVVATVKGLEEGDVVVNNDGKTSHTFTENGSFDFIVRDKLGNETKISATVNCIDKIAPKADVVYSTEELTNKDVVVKLEKFSEEGVVVVNNDGKSEYTFTENGTFEFIIQDKAGNQTIIPVAVNWIDKGGPVVNVSYSTQKLTNKDVIVTLKGLEEGDIVVNNDGKTSYAFTENGSFEFIVRDKVGNETRVPVVVNWIDKVAPTASVQYSVDSWTDEDVIAKLVGLSEEITILNPEVVNNSYTFKENGEFKFEFIDKAGNKGEVVAKVNWIDKTKPEQTITFSETVETEKPVTVTLNINTDEVEILNNDGLATFTFTENGVFTFKLRLRSTGYEFEYPITVDWIKEDSDKEDNDSNEGSTEDSDKEDNDSNGGSTEDSDDEDNNSNGVGNNQSSSSNSVSSGTTGSNTSLGTGTSSKNEEESNISGSFDNSGNSVEEDIVSNEETTSETSNDEEVSNKDEAKYESDSNTDKSSNSNNNESKESWIYVLGTSLGASLLGVFLWLKKSYFALTKK